MTAKKKAGEPERAETQGRKDGPMASKPKAEPDRVVMPSVRADGKPDQSDDFEVIGKTDEPKDD